MAANGTNQSRLRQAQGGSPRDRGSYERDQYYNRATSPNTINNQSGGTQNSMYSNNYNPMGTAGVGGQYGNQQSNLGRYRPPTMNGSGGWNDNGGYAYNLPNSYGATGLGYMSGLGNNMFNPWQGSMNPQMNYGGGMGFQQMLQGLMGRLNGYNSMTGPGMGGGQIGGSRYDQDEQRYGAYRDDPEYIRWRDEFLATNPMLPAVADPYQLERMYEGNRQQQQGQNPNIGRDNRMFPGGGGVNPNPRDYLRDNSFNRGAPSMGGSGGGATVQPTPGLSVPSQGGVGGRPAMGGATPAPSPVGGITNTPTPVPNRFWWGGNGGG